MQMAATRVVIRERFSTCATIRGEASLDAIDDHVIEGRYTIDEKIGEGGFSIVYRGTQVATGRKVALKFPRRTTPDLKARFRREALMLCSLRDPHTVTTYDYDHTASGTPFIVMELLEGVPLREALDREGPMRWDRVCKLLRDICSSLAEAHANGIVHRDIKPDNVFIERRGNSERFKLIDFGIAKPMFIVPDDPDMELTAFGETIGTTLYMSPEQRYAGALDGRSDIYSLGVMAYEALTGRIAETPSALCIPPRLEQVIRRCLEVDKHRRFADVLALVDALDQMTVTSTSFARDLDEPIRTIPDLQIINIEGEP